VPDVTEQLIPVDGGQIWSEQRGRSDGRPVVMLHAGWCDSSSWDGVIARLPAGTRIIRYDSRGYGRSPAPAAPFTELGDLAVVLERLDVHDAVLVGHSLGGATALGLALIQPARLSSLVLAAPGIGDYPWSQDDPYFTEFDTLFTAEDADGLVELGLRTWAATGADELARQQIRSAVAGFFAQDEWITPDPPTLGRLAEIRLPTQVLVGDRDHADVIGCADALVAGLPGCELTELLGADHLLPLREPARLAELISAQLAR
jgi:3-oxoadipate enol-lactonase